MDPCRWVSTSIADCVRNSLFDERVFNQSYNHLCQGLYLLPELGFNDHDVINQTCLHKLTLLHLIFFDLIDLEIHHAHLLLRL